MRALMTQELPDLLIVGGGLSGCLLATRLQLLQPKLKVLLVEQEETLLGNHTWSCHASDIPESEQIWVRALVTQSWDGVRVRFPKHERVLPLSYWSIQSFSFKKIFERLFKGELRTGVSVERVSPTDVTLKNGSVLSARCVVDARGARRDAASPTGYQKFMGLDLKLKKAHGLLYPILMDATVHQPEGFRFFYVLPWSADTLLVEDTYYSECVDLPKEETQVPVAMQAFLEERGWHVEQVLRRERGVLPIPYFPQEYVQQGASTEVPHIGVRGGFFHPVTGYSLPSTVRLISKLLSCPEVNPSSWCAVVKDFALEEQKRYRLCGLLNRILIHGGDPASRFDLLQGFYRLPLDTIARFYANQTSFLDTIRIFARKPPLPLKDLWSCYARSSASYS
jgi:lycopene beta-cyclase